MAKLNESLVILPTYNEAGNLESVLNSLLTHKNIDILVIDDASPDGTGRIADLFSANNPRVNVLHRSGKLGLGTAYVEGFKWGLNNSYSKFIEMDSDGSHPFEKIELIVNLLDSNDLVIGSRYIPGGSTSNWSKSRKLLSLSANIYSNLFLRLGVKDSTSGFRGMSKKFIQGFLDFELKAKGYGFQIGMTNFAKQNGFRIKEFPITFTERINGISKISFDIKVEAFFKVLKWSILNMIK